MNLQQTHLPQDIQTSSRNNKINARRGTQYSINISQAPEEVKERQNGDESQSSNSSESNYNLPYNINSCKSIPDSYQLGSFNSIDQSGNKVASNTRESKTMNKTIVATDPKPVNFSFSESKEKSIHLEEIKEFDGEIESKDSRLKKKRRKRDKIFSNPPVKKFTHK